MLKGINPLIGPDLLAVLARMGHGDELVIADANFPAASVARSTFAGHEFRIDRDAVEVLSAVLSLLPIDDFQPDPVMFMQVVGDPQAVPPVVQAAMPILAEQGLQPTGLERFAFYARAKSAFAVIRTTEGRAYGNFILRKGVIATF